MIPGEETPPLFDPELVRQHFVRAQKSGTLCRTLFDEAAEQIWEKLDGIKTPFENALDLSFLPFLEEKETTSFKKLASAPDLDEEALPFDAESFDLVVSNLKLHWINDLPKALSEFKRILRPNGLFLASLIGGKSLHELREELINAELEITGGASPRVSPMIDLQTAGNLLRHAGFHLPVADVDSLTLLYENLFALMRDLRNMGQTNAHVERLRKPTRKAVFTKACSFYKERHTTPEGLMPASFEIIYLHGWK